MLARALSKVGGLRLAAVLVTLALAVPAVVFADQAQVDADTAKAGQNLGFTSAGNAANESCAARGTPIAGVVTVTYQGNTHYNVGATVTATVTPSAAALAAGIVTSGGSAVVPASYTANGQTFTIGISTTVPATVPNGIYTVQVVTSGAATGSQAVGGVLTLTTNYTITVDCAPQLSHTVGAPSFTSGPSTFVTSATSLAFAVNSLSPLSACLVGIDGPDAGTVADTTFACVAGSNPYTLGAKLPGAIDGGYLNSASATNGSGTGSDSFTVILDNSAPTLGACAGGPFAQGTGMQPVSITAADGGGSGVNAGTSTLSGSVSTATAGTVSFLFTAVDNLGNTSSKSCDYDVLAANVAPSVEAGGPYTGNEGSAIALDGSATDPDGDPLTLLWTATAGAGVDAGAICTFSDATIEDPTVTCTDDGTWTLTLTADDGTAPPVSDTASLTVNNVAPTVVLTGDSPVNEGQTKTYSFDTTDPGVNDTFTAGTPSCGTSGSYVAGSLVYSTSTGDGSFQCSFADDNPSGTASDTTSVSITITDDDLAPGPGSKVVTVNNVAPTVTITGGPFTFDESATAERTITYTVTDPGTDTFPTQTTSCGPGAKVVGSDTFVAPNGSFKCVFADGPVAAGSQVSVSFTDDDSGVGSDDEALTVVNVAPTISALAVSVAIVPVNTAVTATATYSDPGSPEAFTCTFTWDDGGASSSSAGTATSCSSPRTFAAAGVYEVGVTVDDGDSGTASTTYQYVVVYDPSAGFVTGGGWIDSPYGAYRADPTLTGKGTFGFVSKYQKGATTPTGNTEFQFHAAGMNFKSTSYQWLVVSGAKAQYKGVGTVNGVAGYGFLLTATDSLVNGGGNYDKFRIKIWLLGGDVIYDNGSTSSTSADEDFDTSSTGTVISGGSIVIHTKK